MYLSVQEEDENVKNEVRQYAIELDSGVIAGSPCKRRQDIKILIEFPSTEVDKKDIPGLLMKYVSSSNRRLWNPWKWKWITENGTDVAYTFH